MGHHVLWVKDFLPAELTAALRQELIQSLFQEWLQGEFTYRLYHQPEAAEVAEANAPAMADSV
jgi:hypothetical protein